MLQEEMTMEDALQLMDIGQRQPNRAAPALPPKIISELYTMNKKHYHRSFLVASYYAIRILQ